MPWVHERRQDSTQVIAEETYYLDGDGNVTTDSAAAVSQLAAKGSPISKEVREKYGIPTAPAKPEKVAQADETEKSAGPAQNKAKAPKKNKGAK